MPSNVVMFPKHPAPPVWVQYKNKRKEPVIYDLLLEELKIIEIKRALVDFYEQAQLHEANFDEVDLAAHIYAERIYDQMEGDDV